MAWTWDAQTYQAPFTEWPHEFVPSVPENQQQLGAFLFVSGQLASSGQTAVGVDILVDESILAATSASVRPGEAFTLVNEVLAVLPPAEQYSVRFESAHLTPECQLSASVVSLMGLGGASLALGRQSAQGDQSGALNIPVTAPRPAGYSAAAAFVLQSAQVFYGGGAPPVPELSVNGSSYRGYAYLGGQTPMPPVFLDLSVASPPDYQFALQGTGPTSLVESYATTSVVELEQPDR